jgi:hypothetical protein
MRFGRHSPSSRLSSSSCLWLSDFKSFSAIVLKDRILLLGCELGYLVREGFRTVQVVVFGFLD